MCTINGNNYEVIKARGKIWVTTSRFGLAPDRLIMRREEIAAAELATGCKVIDHAFLPDTLTLQVSIKC